MTVTDVDVIKALVGVLAAIITHQVVEIRKDVRWMRDRVLVLWEWYENNVGVKNGPPGFTATVERKHQ